MRRALRPVLRPWRGGMACVSALRWRASAPRSGPPSAPVQLQLDAVPFDAVRKPEALLLVAIGRDGDASRSSTSRAELAASLKFPLRDLRCLTKAFDISQVLVRPEAVVVNLKYVRAVLTAGKVLLLDEMHVPEELVTGVRRRIKSPFPVRNEPFEVLVLEALLHYMHERLEADYNELEPSIYALLASLEGGDPTESQLRALLNLSKQLGAFAYDVGELKETLDRLQASDEDMAQMYLSRGPSEAGSDHHEIEILLENYSRRLEEIRNSVSELQGYIQATEAYLKIRYDSQRNTIMRQTLMLSMGTFSMGCGTAVAALFGMNLLSSMEQHPHMFYIVSGGVTTSSLAIFLALLTQHRRSRQ